MTKPQSAHEAVRCLAKFSSFGNERRLRREHEEKDRRTEATGERENATRGVCGPK